jgi:hypothetical protein
MGELGKQALKTSTTLLGKLASKKFLVFLIATHMTYFSFLAGEQWVFIALLFMGVEGALDWKHGPISALKQPPQSDGELQGLPSQSTTL